MPLGDIYEKQGNTNRAEQLYREALVQEELDGKGRYLLETRLRILRSLDANK